ncbi:MAG: SDR family oxidoreductase [Paludibacteraceae bacterium]
MEKVIFITGASKGFGKHWAETLLQNGFKVAATARKLSDLDDLVATYGEAVLPLELDVNDREACFSAIEKAHGRFGRIDVLISNAGYGQFGMIEELSEAEARQQLETNVFGSLWVIQAVLPIMRSQNSGHILQVSSIGGIVAYPSLGIYHASKWAVEGMCEALSKEIAMFGIKVTLIEPGGYSTEWGNKSAKFSQPIEAYNPIRDFLKNMGSKMEQGVPNATGQAILQVINSDNPPLRLFLGSNPLPNAEATYKARLETWREWNEVSVNAQK